MNILVIGSGGREHALAWAIASSPLLDTLYCAPGNGGMADISTCVDISVDDFDGIIQFCTDKEIDFVVVGPEAPLTEGLVDRLDAEGIKSFGPSREAAQLEGSKGFMKDLCADYNIPTAAYERFLDPESAIIFLDTLTAPYVIKADGLAAGKGVIIAETKSDAEEAVRSMFSGSFGTAGEEIVIEEFMEGEEASFFALTDGKNALPLATAQDHKRVFDGDKGPNTGGMGAYSPAPVMTPALCDEVMTKIIEPTIQGMAERGAPYKGVLYAGLMITKDGPKLIEYNVRFGDPECQVLVARLMSDLVPLLVATYDGTLDQMDARWNDKAAMTVVMAAEGYPGAYEKGSEIGNLAAAAEGEDRVIFHAGTKKDGNILRSNGGRVLNITALGATIGAAREAAYDATEKVDWPQGFYRKDIGWRAIEREQ